MDAPLIPHRGIPEINTALFDINQSDVTGRVNMASPGAVVDAICAILATRYPGFDEVVLRDGFIDLEDIFWGRYPGYLQCDTPYHDLRHSMSTALAMARLVDGYEIEQGGSFLGAELAMLGVLLALFHDVGFIRTLAEAGTRGACLIREHEQRSVDFMRSYLAAGPLAGYARYAELIHTTNFARNPAATLEGLDVRFADLGKMLGTADLISQIAGRYYLERCRHYLYEEFVTAGADRMVEPSGEIVILYATPEELLSKTPGFYEHLVKPRLEKDFDRAYRHIAAHFGGDDPYSRAVQRNLDFLRGMIAEKNFARLGRKPVPLMP